MTHLLGISSNDPKTSNEAWEIAKKIVDEGKEPLWEELANVTPIIQGEHGDGKNKHELQKITKSYEIYPKITVNFSYAVCKECKKTIWKKFTAYNNRSGISYERNIVKYGEIV